jgi:hypothetical protein
MGELSDLCRVPAEPKCRLSDGYRGGLIFRRDR